MQHTRFKMAGRSVRRRAMRIIDVGGAGIVALAIVLTTPAPKAAEGKQDLSGVWRITTTKYLNNLAADGRMSPLQPPAAALFKQRQQTAGKDRPSSRCLPRGLPSAMLVRDEPWKIIQTSGTIVILFDELLHYRQIFTDGRGFPSDSVPTWFGYSIGKWDGDTLVAETTGFNDQTWLDEGGHPHSDAMRLTERFRRRSPRNLDISITIDDPKSYTRPWDTTLHFELAPEAALGEHVCASGGFKQ